MKMALLLLLMGVSVIGSVRAQAPSSQAGLTYRSVSQALSMDFPDHMLRVVDLKSDGTYVGRLELSQVFNFQQLSYQPLVNGTYTYSVLSATQASLTLAPAGAGPQSHILTFTDSSDGTLGGITSPPVSALVEWGAFSLSPTAAAGLRNVSTLVSLLPGNSTTVGFIVGGTQLKEYVIRCIGPTLGNFGVPNCAADPSYTLYWGPNFTEEFQLPGEQPILDEPRPAVGWSATAAAATIAGEGAKVGAFPLASLSRRDGHRNGLARPKIRLPEASNSAVLILRPNGQLPWRGGRVVECA